MTIIQAIILGIIQGLTEFLPVSSSTHLAIAKKLMGIGPTEWMVTFDLMCHFGTTLAIMIVLWKDVWKVLTSIREIARFTLALLPLIPAYFLFKPVRLLLAPDAGFFLLAMSALLFIASKPNIPQLSSPPKWRDMIWIGTAQGLSLLPGFSRSGSTISTARLLGWKWDDAVRFSFLLAIPTILGGSLMETVASIHSLSSIPWAICWAGWIAALVVGMGAIRLLFWILKKGTLRPFAWYCLAIGILAIVWLR